MGALVTVNPPVGSAVLDLPWIITFGPLGDDEDWEPVLCGPYERAHALAMARAVVVEDDLMAVVEPVAPRLSVERIREDIVAARASAAGGDAAGTSAVHGDPTAQGDLTGMHMALDEPLPEGVPAVEQVRSGLARIAELLSQV